MISEKRRKELEAEGKIETGNVVAIKKPKKNTAISKSMEDTDTVQIVIKNDRKSHKQGEATNQTLEKIIETLEASKNMKFELPKIEIPKIEIPKIEMPRDKDLVAIVKILPKIIEASNKRHADLLKEIIGLYKALEGRPITIENNQQDKTKIIKSKVTKRDKYNNIEEAEHEIKTVES